MAALALIAVLLLAWPLAALANKTTVMSPSEKLFHNIRLSQGIRSNADPKSGRTAVFTLSSGDFYQMNDGQYALCSFEGIVWEDGNADGMLAKTEVGLPQVTVKLFNDTNDAYLRETLTDAKGRYVFEDLDPGSYYIKVFPVNIPKKSYKFSPKHQLGQSKVFPLLGRSETIVLSSRTRVYGIHAGLYQTGCLEGTLWLDSNANGKFDHTEKGHSGITINLLCNTDTSFIKSAVTNSRGVFEFVDLEPGGYHLEFVLPEGVRMSSSASSTGGWSTSKARGAAPPPPPASLLRSASGAVISRPVTISSGECPVTYSQGLYALAAVGGVVWNDLNANGEKDDAEPCTEGVEVTLHRHGVAAGAPAFVPLTTKTDTMGRYVFGDLEPGQYYVEFDLPPGHQHSPINRR